MKTMLLTVSLVLLSGISFGQNINDHKISFSYIQLPLMKIDTQFDQYNITVEKAYEQANADSTAQYEARQKVAMELFQRQVATYYHQRDSLNRIHLQNLADWERKVNAASANPEATAPEQPLPPNYPTPPMYPDIKAPILHSDYTDENVLQRVNLSGYDQGAGEVEITITIHPIRSINIVSTKKGTGAATKYNYTARYILPIGVKVATPSQGILMETTLYEQEQSYTMREQTSQYDQELYMMDNRETFFRELESYARSQALSRANDYLNDNFGFVTRTRVAEIYSVKSYKGYDYSDVTNAFTKTTFALQAVGNDRDRSGAMDEIQAAMDAIKGVLEESNLSDNKARINDKITAMLQCNLAELYIWQAEFDKADATVNIAMNSGEGKAKRHLKDELGFYQDQRKRWQVHY